MLPAVVGIFWGAPMVARELEAGTSRLVWTQSITRTRWLATKLGVAGAGAVAVGLFGLVLTWWCGPLDDAVAKGYGSNGLYSQPRLWPVLFGARGVVPIGMTVLALVIGVTLGLLIRRAVRGDGSDPGARGRGPGGDADGGPGTPAPHGAPDREDHAGQPHRGQGGGTDVGAGDET